MSAVEITPTAEEEEKKVVKLSSISGGRGAGNWLWNLPVNTTFLCQKKMLKDDPQVYIYHIVGKTDKAVVLLDNQNDKEFEFLVDPVRFCVIMDLFEILARGEE